MLALTPVVSARPGICGVINPIAGREIGPDETSGSEKSSSLGNVCQEWDVTAVGSHYTISNVGNGMVLDAVDCETADGTVVRQWAQLDNTCQQWDIKP